MYEGFLDRRMVGVAKSLAGLGLGVLRGSAASEGISSLRVPCGLGFGAFEGSGFSGFDAHPRARQARLQIVHSPPLRVAEHDNNDTLYVTTNTYAKAVTKKTTRMQPLTAAIMSPAGFRSTTHCFKRRPSH